MAAALGLVLGLCLSGWGAADVEPPPSPPPALPCTLVEQGGPGGALKQRPALLRLGGGVGGDPDTPPRGLDPNDTFDVTDPWGALSVVWGPPRTTPPPKCELSPTVPVLTPPTWAPTLNPDARSPPGLGGPWWVASLGTPRYGLTALLQGQPPPAPPALTASLSVFTLTPELRGSPGAPLDLHCAFAAPPHHPHPPFALEWRHQHRGSGRPLLTYHSAAHRVPTAAPGVRLLLGGAGGATREVTLRLDPLAVTHEGTYVCSIFLPHGQAQTLLNVHVLAPPKVTLRPTPLVVAPGGVAELRCETSGYFPLDVGVQWQRRAGPSGPPLAIGDTLAQSWTSGHRQGPDGTFSRSSGARLVPAKPHHHGDIYTCLVTHAALATPRRVHVRLEVAGVEGPALEDAVGLFLVAFVLCGVCRCLRPPPPQPHQDPKEKRP